MSQAVTMSEATNMTDKASTSMDPHRHAESKRGKKRRHHSLDNEKSSRTTDSGRPKKKRFTSNSPDRSTRPPEAEEARRQSKKSKRASKKEQKAAAAVVARKAANMHSATPPVPNTVPQKPSTGLSPSQKDSHTRSKSPESDSSIEFVKALPAVSPVFKTPRKTSDHIDSNKGKTIHNSGTPAAPPEKAMDNHTPRPHLSAVTPAEGQLSVESHHVWNAADAHLRGKQLPVTPSCEVQKESARHDPLSASSDRLRNEPEQARYKDTEVHSAIPNPTSTSTNGASQKLDQKPSSISQITSTTAQLAPDTTPLLQKDASSRSTPLAASVGGLPGPAQNNPVVTPQDGGLLITGQKLATSNQDGASPKPAPTQTAGSTSQKGASHTSTQDPPPTSNSTRISPDAMAKTSTPASDLNSTPLRKHGLEAQSSISSAANSPINHTEPPVPKPALASEAGHTIGNASLGPEHSSRALGSGLAPSKSKAQGGRASSKGKAQGETGFRKNASGRPAGSSAHTYQTLQNDDGLKTGNSRASPASAPIPPSSNNPQKADDNSTNLPSSSARSAASVPTAGTSISVASMPDARVLSHRPADPASTQKNHFQAAGPAQAQAIVASPSRQSTHVAHPSTSHQASLPQDSSQTGPAQLMSASTSETVASNQAAKTPAKSRKTVSDTLSLSSRLTQLEQRINEEMPLGSKPTATRASASPAVTRSPNVSSQHPTAAIHPTSADSTALRAMQGKPAASSTASSPPASPPQGSHHSSTTQSVADISAPPGTARHRSIQTQLTPQHGAAQPQEASSPRQPVTNQAIAAKLPSAATQLSTRDKASQGTATQFVGNYASEATPTLNSALSEKPNTRDLSGKPVTKFLRWNGAHKTSHPETGLIFRPDQSDGVDLERTVASIAWSDIFMLSAGKFSIHPEFPEVVEYPKARPATPYAEDRSDPTPRVGVWLIPTPAPEWKVPLLQVPDGFDNRALEEGLEEGDELDLVLKGRESRNSPIPRFEQSHPVRLNGPPWDLRPAKHLYSQTSRVARTFIIRHVQKSANVPQFLCLPLVNALRGVSPLDSCLRSKPDRVFDLGWYGKPADPSSPKLDGTSDQVLLLLNTTGEHVKYNIVRADPLVCHLLRNDVRLSPWYDADGRLMDGHTGKAAIGSEVNYPQSRIAEMRTIYDREARAARVTETQASKVWASLRSQDESIRHHREKQAMSKSDIRRTKAKLARAQERLDQLHQKYDEIEAERDSLGSVYAAKQRDLNKEHSSVMASEQQKAAEIMRQIQALQKQNTTGGDRIRQNASVLSYYDEAQRLWEIDESKRQLAQQEQRELEIQRLQAMLSNDLATEDDKAQARLRLKAMGAGASEKVGDPEQASEAPDEPMTIDDELAALAAEAEEMA